MRFNNKIVLVTGAGAGIGRATVICFGKEGAKVAINSLTPRNGIETLRQLEEAGGQGIYIQGDVSKKEDVKLGVEETIKTYGRIDILVNNAGVLIPGRVDNTSEEDWDRIIEVNLKGVFLVSKYVVREMLKAGGGVIVNVGSVVAIKGGKERGAYAASKGGVLALTKAMAADYVGENIRVNFICAATTETAFIEKIIQSSSDPAKARADFISRIPMGRLAKAEDIAVAILFAASDEAAFMTGATIAFDGGKTTL
jgi:meso-butanediol dehydrogenase/(S,S)-butanediol dehydrogenase/diacetyl reductase